MSAAVAIAAAAHSDIDTIFDFYLAIDVQVGRRFKNELAEAIARLADFPRLGAIRARGRRTLVFRTLPYILFYRITSNGGVLVTRVLHQSQNRD